MSVVVSGLTLDKIKRVKTIMPQIRKELVDKTVFVDSGSRDEIVEEIQRLEFRVIHQHNRMVVKI